MKTIRRLFVALGAIVSFSFHSNAQFLDQFENFLDKVTGYEQELTTPSKAVDGRSYGLNPGLEMLCREAVVEADKATIILTFYAPADSVGGIVLSASDPNARISFGTPEIADSLAIFVVSPSYAPMGKPKKGENKQKTPEMLNVGSPQVALDIPAGEMKDVMVVYYDFPKKLKKIERLDLRLRQTDSEESPRYFGFTFDNIPLLRKK